MATLVAAMCCYAPAAGHETSHSKRPELRTKNDSKNRDCIEVRFQLGPLRGVRFDYSTPRAQPKYCDRCTALDRFRAKRIESRLIAQLPSNALTTDDRVTEVLGQTLQPCRDIYRVADGRVLVSCD